MKKTIALLLAVLMLTMCLAACGKTAAPADQGTEGSAPTADATATDGTAAKTSLKVGVVSDPATFAPYQTNMNSQQTTLLLYEGLFRLNGKNELEPKLAESYEAEDAMHYTIKIREGIKDSAGNPFTASDALFTMKTALEHGVFQLFALDLENCEAVDDLTLKLSLSYPDRSLLANLSMVPMVTEKAYTESPDEMVTTPVGTGPYKLVNWIPGSSVTFTYNENYWGEEPSIKDVEYLIITEETQRTTALATGAADLVYNVATGDVEYIKSTEGLTIQEVPSIRTCGIFFNCSESSLCNNEKLRLAIAHAIEKEAIKNVAFGGYAETATSFFSPYCTDQCDDYMIDDYYKYDLDMAKQLMADSGVAEGTELTLILWPSPGLNEAAVQIQGMLEKLGLKINIIEYENTLFTDIINGDPEKYDIALNMFLPPSGYTHDALFVVNMWTHMTEPLASEFGGLYGAAGACLDPTEFQAIMTGCQKTLYEHAPLVSFCHTTYIYGYNSALSVPQYFNLENLDVTALSWN